MISAEALLCSPSSASLPEPDSTSPLGALSGAACDDTSGLSLAPGCDGSTTASSVDTAADASLPLPLSCLPSSRGVGVVASMRSGCNVAEGCTGSAGAASLRLLPGLLTSADMSDPTVAASSCMSPAEEADVASRSPPVGTAAATAVAVDAAGAGGADGDPLKGMRTRKEVWLYRPGDSLPSSAGAGELATAGGGSALRESAADASRPSLARVVLRRRSKEEDVSAGTGLRAPWSPSPIWVASRSCAALTSSSNPPATSCCAEALNSFKVSRLRRVMAMRGSSRMCARAADAEDV